uniref:Uncharacterized protein n=1 Tax=Oryza sativa subsp. japonica TaxID=39947 RepID=Q6ZKQ9_ORYSJ|nr:hypothetical protein [Oryza sativa Japonica Group]
MEGVTVAASRGRSHRNQTDAACCLGRTQGYDGESLRPRHRAPAAPRVAGWLWPIARYLHAMRPAPMPQEYERRERFPSSGRTGMGGIESKQQGLTEIDAYEFGHDCC